MVVLAKVFVLTKDEYDLIEDFILYYSHLVGLENIIVIDNGSTNARVLEVYKKYRSKGLGGLYQHKGNFYNGGSIMSAYMNHYRNECKFMIPLDTDEFVYFSDQEKMTRKDFENYLNSIPDNISIIRYGTFFAAVPDQNAESYKSYRHERPALNITKFYDQGWDKVFVRASTFQKISLGNHNASVTSGDKMISSRLGLLHFQETGSLRQFERAINAMKGYGYVSLEESPQEQLLLCLKHRSGAGGHHCMYMVRFLLRILFINVWIIRLGSMPTLEHIKWADNLFTKIPPGLDVSMLSDLPVKELSDKLMELAYEHSRELLLAIDKHINSINLDEPGLENNNENKLRLIFHDWTFPESSITVIQVQNILQSIINS